MTVIKCHECGNENTDTAIACVGCGASIARNSMADAIEKPEKRPKSDSKHDCEVFKSALDASIDVKFAEIMRGKIAGKEFLTYVDAQILTAAVRGIFRHNLKIVPQQIEIACSLSEAVLAPSVAERTRLIKVALGGGGAIAGVAMIIGGVGAALGWGAGVVASVTAVFVGGHLFGPVAWATSGLAIAGIAAYFATTSNNQVDTERFLKVLKNTTKEAVDSIWPDQGEALSKSLTNRS